jgi:hypothetical protein
MFLGVAFGIGMVRPAVRFGMWTAATSWLIAHALFHLWEVTVGICGPSAMHRGGDPGRHCTFRANRRPRGFSESLSYELASLNIVVKIIEPGGVISTNFGKRSSDEAAHNAALADYDAFVAGANALFARLRTPRLATEQDVAEVIFGAATDGTTRLRYVATNDILPLVNARRETSEQEYVEFMRSHFQPKLGSGEEDRPLSRPLPNS